MKTILDDHRVLMAKPNDLKDFDGKDDLLGTLSSSQSRSRLQLLPEMQHTTLALRNHMREKASFSTFPMDGKNNGLNFTTTSVSASPPVDPPHLPVIMKIAAMQHRLVLEEEARARMITQAALQEQSVSSVTCSNSASGAVTPLASMGLYGNMVGTDLMESSFAAAVKRRRLSSATSSSYHESLQAGGNKNFWPSASLPPPTTRNNFGQNQNQNQGQIQARQGQRHDDIVEIRFNWNFPLPVRSGNPNEPKVVSLDKYYKKWYQISAKLSNLKGIDEQTKQDSIKELFVKSLGSEGGRDRTIGLQQASRQKKRSFDTYWGR